MTAPLNAPKPSGADVLLKNIERTCAIELAMTILCTVRVDALILSRVNLCRAHGGRNGRINIGTRNIQGTRSYGGTQLAEDQPTRHRPYVRLTIPPRRSTIYRFRTMLTLFDLTGHAATAGKVALGASTSEAAGDTVGTGAPPLPVPSLQRSNCPPHAVPDTTARVENPGFSLICRLSAIFDGGD